MSDQEPERSPTQSTVNVVLAVLITAGVVWVATDRRAPDCGVVPNPNFKECTTDFYTWNDLTFPNQPYIDEFHEH